MLQQTIETDIKKAMLAREIDKLSCLRMLKSALQNAAIAAQHELSDAEIMAVIQKEVKKRKEAAELYKNANQPELQAHEEQNLVWLTPYLPVQLSESELKDLAVKAKEQIIASGQTANLGAMMKIIIPQVQGRADGAILKAVVEQII